MNLQTNPPFKDDFEDYSVQVSLEHPQLDRRIRVQEGSKNSRSERKNQRENSKGLMVGRKQRERKRERRKHKT